MSLHDERLFPPHVLTDMEKRPEPKPFHFRKDAWVDPAQARDRAMEDLAEEIAAIEDELAYKRAEYARLDQWVPEPSPQPSLDARGLKSTGTDEREAWR